MGTDAAIHITHDVLDVGAVTEIVRHPGAGAIATFVGTTRDHTGDRRVLRLEYEAYRRWPTSSFGASRTRCVTGGT